MSRLAFMFSCFAVMTTAVWLSGCDTSSKADSKSESKSGSGYDRSEHDDHAGHTHGDGDADHGEIERALAKLSPADRAAAEQQKMCPVLDEPLGSMGTPIKLHVQGRDVFICCEGCEEDLRDDPAKYFAKLKQ